MDLFLINRYVGDETEISLNQEEKNLQKLKQRIEERKKSYQSQKNQNIDSEITLTPQLSQTQPSKLEGPKESVIEEQAKLPTESKTKQKRSEKLTADFKVLGTKEFEKKLKVKRVLPQWLTSPQLISTSLQDLTCKVEKQEWLSPTLRNTLKNDGINHLFPVQEKVVPFVLNAHKVPGPLWPSDICVSAPTGSGKTLAFVLPIIQLLVNELGREVRAVIVLPVQELAAQVAKVFRKYCSNTGLKVALLSGLSPLRQEQHQIVRLTESKGWVSEVDIIVSTAGRLVEHLQNTEGFSLKHLKFLVIDEADRIMDHIQNDWLYHLDKHIMLDNKLMTGKVPSLSWHNLTTQRMPPQKLLFSATLSQDPEKLEQWGLFQPKLFSVSTESVSDDEDLVTKYTTPEELEERCIICEVEQKPIILYHLIKEEKWSRVLCFTNAAQSAHRLAALLTNMCGQNITIADVSASLDRATRETVLKNFHTGKVNVLISTDALARGIDVPNCDYVISYDPPKSIKTYIHRVGRTGRAGRQGCAVTLLQQNQTNLFKDLLQSGGKKALKEMKIEVDFAQLSDIYGNAMLATKQQIHGEIQSSVSRAIALKRRATNRNKRKRNNSDASMGNKRKK